jgi:hypothetical protein
MSQVAPLLRGRSDSGAPCRAPGLRRGRIFYGVMGRSPTARSAREVRSGVAQLFIPVGRASLRREVEDASTSMTLLRGATAGSRWRGPPARRYEARSRRHSPPRSTQALSAASCPASRHPRHRGRSRRWATRRPFRARAWSARCRAPARRAPRRRRLGSPAPWRSPCRSPGHRGLSAVRNASPRIHSSQSLRPSPTLSCALLRTSSTPRHS